MTEPLDPNKYHVLTPAGKKRIIFAGLFFVLIVLPFLLRAYYRVAINRPSQSGKEVSVEIMKGEGVADIARNLVDKGAINSDFLFNVYVYTGNLGTKIQAGTYKIPAGSNLKQVVEIIQHGTNIDFEEFVSLAKDSEGFLFPDTYSINKDIQEKELLSIFTSTFTEKTKDILTEDKLSKAGLTKEQVVIFASMLEREIHSEEDRPVVAGIIIKRWREEMKLDVDATTQYVAAWQDICGAPERCIPAFEEVVNFDWWPTILTQDDLELESPYNTRKNLGLPPAPISNPGLSAIEAVLNAQQSPYYFYLTDSEGVAHYAVTLDQHNFNTAKYLN
ncbi:MAG: Aminodeoxychorismate lyase [candidate division WWE3 bacterium GW2011_GWB1_42_6]|uniref:Endolytic murein transglycosylase n=1 Tax=candidate division WWE3 bacterium GW2011_GWB1_42_6 TaxID=1619115 RepID=A0A0G1B0N4_UNCKA|nr:MAG: Aminodeoxychorismate lyase [candidate division WWE3 bacterium GW2011_GWB1_42_6]